MDYGNDLKPKPQGLKTNDLKKGTRVRLKNGWEAEIFDNMRGNIRQAKVFGDYTEIGSIYAHDIDTVINPDGTETKIELDEAKKKVMKMNKGLFGE